MRTENMLGRLLAGVDRITTGSSRVLARHTSRRSFLGRTGAFMAGLAAFPMLPVYREVQAALPEHDSVVDEMGDPNSCEYWRYCAFSGAICGCCGGTATTCPPGSEVASVAWVGTCHNPADGQDYLISYNDCCGKSSCGRCRCSRSEGEKPVYFPSKANTVLWCFGADSHAYHCTLGLVIGKADSTVVG